MVLGAWLTAVVAVAISTTAVEGRGITNLHECKPWVVDEGADIDLALLQLKQRTVSARFRAFYNNFFSKGDYELQDQMYFIQLDKRQPLEPVITRTKSRMLTVRFTNVTPGKHKLFYGSYSIDQPTNRRVAEGRAVCFNSSPPAPSSSAPPSPNSSYEEPTAFQEDDIRTVLRGIYAIGPRLAMAFKSPSDMPSADPWCHYAGRTSDGKLMIWYNRASYPKDFSTESDSLRAQTAALAIAAMDSGAAGPIWKERFDKELAPTRLGRAFAAAFEMLSDRQAKKSRDDIAWIHTTITLGMSRAAVYALLKKRDLLATNPIYNPGRPFAGNGCSYEDTTAAQWPRMNEPVPKAGCKFDFRERKFVPNPDAFVDFDTGFSVRQERDVDILVRPERPTNVDQGLGRITDLSLAEWRPGDSEFAIVVLEC